MVKKRHLGYAIFVFPSTDEVGVSFLHNLDEAEIITDCHKAADSHSQRAKKNQPIKPNQTKEKQTKTTTTHIHKSMKEKNFTELIR